MEKPVRTQYLFNSVIANPHKMFEVRLIVNRFMVATHFMYFNGKNFYDEGIDGENRRVSRDGFFKYYPNNYWLIDEIL